GPRVARTARVPCRVPGAPGGPKVALEFERCVIGVLSAENPDNATLERAPRFCLERTRLPAPWSCLGRTRLLGLPGLPGPSGRWGLRAHSRWGFRAPSPAGPPCSLPRCGGRRGGGADLGAGDVEGVCGGEPGLGEVGIHQAIADRVSATGRHSHRCPSEPLGDLVTEHPGTEVLHPADVQ